MKKIIGVFEEAKGFGFIVPSDKKNFKNDFFVTKSNSFGAKNGDLVEAEELKNTKGKNREAKIIKIFKKGNHIPEEDLIVGTYSKNKNNDFGFIDVEGLEKGFFVHDKNRLSANDGDIVEAILKNYNGRKEARIINILERKKNFVVGEFKVAKDKNFGFIIPSKKSFDRDVFVALSNSSGAKNGDFVGAEIVKYSGKSPEGVITDIIGKKGKIDKREEDVLSIALDFGARISFGDEIKKELENFSEKIDKSELENRKDLRKIFTFTIDGEDAKDLDDAISIEKNEFGDFVLYVSIADVSNYVLENSALDKEALKRATSIYMADRVIPMLPEKLSNNLCSLNPNTDKLTLTCEMHIGAKTGHTVKSKVYTSVINSDFRLTYREVDEIISGKIKVGEKLKFGGIVTEKLLEKIFLSNDLKKNILKFREKKGVLNFEFPETYITFDEKGNPNGIKPYPVYDSNKMIESFMVSANEAVAKEFFKSPFLFRIHEIPKSTDISDLEEKLKLFSVNFKFKNVTTSEFALLLDKFKDLEEAKKIFLEKMVLRTLTQAIYSEKNEGHFGLGLEFYSHFTSPIRRYPDLQIHRIIKEIISKKFNLERKIHYKKILSSVAKTSSEKERNAEKLEYRVRDYFIVKYYKNKVGQEFEAIISGVISKGFFVQLPDTAEGFVELKNSIFDESLQSHKIDGKKYMLADKVKVKLIEADENLNRLNFEIL